MKKLLLILGILMTIISLAGCDRSLDAFQLLDRSHEVEIDSMVIEMTLDVEMFILAQDRSIGMSTMMRGERESENLWKSKTSIMIGGEYHETTTFVRDGNEYIEERIAGFVSNRTRSEFNDNDTSSGDMFFTQFITEDTTSDSLLTSIDEGYRLEFVLNIEGITLVLEELDFEGISIQSDLDEEKAHHTAVIYLDEDYHPTSVEIALEGIDILFDGEEMILTLNLMITAIQLGNVTVEFPDWLDDEPISGADLAGVWAWGISDDHFLYFSTVQRGFLFYKGGSSLGGMIRDDGLEFIQFDWEILNHNHLYLHFDISRQTSRYEIFIEGDVLTRVNLDNGDSEVLYFYMTLVEFSEFLESLTDEIVERGAYDE